LITFSRENNIEGRLLANYSDKLLFATKQFNCAFAYLRLRWSCSTSL